MFDNPEDGLIKSHQPCPCGDSSDAFSYYKDGGYCFSGKCDKKWYTNTELGIEGEDIQMNALSPDLTQQPTDLSSGVVSEIPDRKITKDTCKFFGVSIKHDDQGKELNHYYPYHDASGVHIANKVRGRGKSFLWEGSSKAATLFGQQLFGANTAKAITVVEGELDALSCYQLLGSRYPVVSVQNGAGNALKSCKQNYKYLDSFPTIALCFDNDEDGINAANAVAQLFPNKAKIVKLQLKDASEYLKENKQKEFTNCWFSAEKYTPANIVRGEDLLDRLRNQPTPESLKLPWEGLQDLTYGIRKGEMWTITSGSGMGKTQVLRELSYHIQQHTEDNIGLLFLEDPIEDAARGMMSLSAGKPLHLPTTEFTQDEWENAFNDTLGTGRYAFFDSFGSNDIDTIVNTIKYMRYGCDCRYIFLDHISILVSDQSAGDERKALDEIATKLKTLTIELDIWLGMVSHSKRPAGKPHEEGGQTGPACHLHYDRNTGRLTQIEDPDKDPELETIDDGEETNANLS